MTKETARVRERAGTDAVGDAYRRRLRSRGYREERREKAEVILRLCGSRLRTSRRAADLGAGTGLVKKELEAYTGNLIAGFELDRSFIVWRQGIAVADVLRLPVADGAFDFLLLNHLYEHVEDQAGLFREAHRALEAGGEAYVAAGNRWAVMEPHYRLPFLSWLPRRAAGAYLLLSGRGREYEGIRFRTHRTLVGLMERAGFRVEDTTEEGLERLLGAGGRGGWGSVWRLLRRLPARLRRSLLRGLSPQWFFLLHKPEAPGGGEAPADRGERTTGRSGG